MLWRILYGPIPIVVPYFIPLPALPCVRKYGPFIWSEDHMKKLLNPSRSKSIQVSPWFLARGVDIINHHLLCFTFKYYNADNVNSGHTPKSHHLFSFSCFVSFFWRNRTIFSIPVPGKNKHLECRCKNKKNLQWCAIKMRNFH